MHKVGNILFSAITNLSATFKPSNWCHNESLFVFFLASSHLVMLHCFLFFFFCIAICEHDATMNKKVKKAISSHSALFASNLYSQIGSRFASVAEKNDFFPIVLVTEWRCISSLFSYKTTMQINTNITCSPFCFQCNVWLYSFIV